MLVLKEQICAEKPNPGALRKMKREDLGRELDRRRKEQLRYASTSRAYARAAEQLRAVYDEFIRRDEKRQDGTVKPAEMTQANASGERRS
jgi:hypothetical protein